MAFARSAMASGLAAAAVGEGERAGQQVLWKGKVAEAGKLPSRGPLPPPMPERMGRQDLPAARPRPDGNRHSRLA
jgi:hypothetical protein